MFSNIYKLILVFKFLFFKPIFLYWVYSRIFGVRRLEDSGGRNQALVAILKSVSPSCGAVRQTARALLWRFQQRSLLTLFFCKKKNFILKDSLENWNIQKMLYYPKFDDIKLFDKIFLCSGY